jgi:SAM-dependent methyltransferase
MPDLDYTFGESSVLSAPAASYDYVLSTQVLEHVKEPAGYLAECRRLLGPDGQLVLTTHGLFPDHACPFDFQRWTADGLRLAVEQAGLKIEQVLKLSTNGRALVTFNQMFNDRLLVRKKSIAGYALRLSRLVYTRLNPARLNQMCDEEYADCRVVAAETPGHELYIALMVVARRAGESA